jgi:hypothetical protein
MDYLEIIQKSGVSCSGYFGANYMEVMGNVYTPLVTSSHHVRRKELWSPMRMDLVS